MALASVLVPLLLLAAARPVVWAQVSVAGSCPQHQVVHNFNFKLYLGKWYEYQKLNFSKATGVCNTAEYYVGQTGGVVVRNTEYDPRTGEKNEVVGSARLNSTAGEGKLMTSFPVSGNVWRPYLVLSTDYANYTVVWSCLDLGSTSMQFSWVLTRQKEPSAGVLWAVDQVLQSRGLSSLPYNRTPQNCHGN
ncbi:lazarillo protein-like [Bacillus rossius redtenbacheri]|uniref:lazarillo protein-like n=1 Tax=Bacillus rossius redtenbacheri TaxID=93214 RepID=UPI002FDEE604